MNRRRKWVSGLGCAVVVLALAPGLARLTVDVSNESFFVEGDPTLRDYRALRAQFGSDEVVYLLLEVDDAFAQPHLDVLLRLGADLAALPHVEEVRSPLHSEVVYSEGGVVEGRSFAEAAPPSDQRVMWRARILGYGPFQGRLIGSGGRWVGFLVRLDGRDRSPSRRAEVSAALGELLSRRPYRDYELAAVGTPLNATRFAELLVEELQRSLGWGLGIALFALWFLVGSWRGILGPCVVVVGSLVGTFGLMGVLGVPLSTVSSILVTLLVCVGVADGMHLVVAYERAAREEGPDAALAVALSRTAPPCALTSLTTGVGFLALLTSDLAPVRHLGLFAAFGCVLALALTLGSLPLLLSGWRPAPRSDPWGRLLRRLLAGVVRRPRSVALLLGACLLAAAAGSTRLVVDHDFLAYLPEDEPLRQRIEFVQERMGGAVAVELVFDTGAPEGIKDAAFLRDLEEYRRWAARLDPMVRAVSSVTEGVGEMHSLFDGPRAVPDGDGAAGQLLWMLQMVDAEAYERLVSLDEQRTRLTLRVDVTGSRRYQKVLDALVERAEAQFAGRSTVALTGEAVLLARMKDYVLETQAESFGLAFLCVAAMIFFLARGLRLGAIALVPNLGPIAAVLGLMGWLGIAIEVSNALLAAVALGIVVDDTIHVVHGYRSARTAGQGVEAALQTTLAGAGRAVLFTSLVLILAFSVYATSALGNVRTFGLLAALTFLAALLADLILLPALLVCFDREAPLSS